jgi:sialic acid synthase SpsE
MSQFIIEMGSGNTCRNDPGIVREMIDAVADVDSGKHEIVLKWQIFKEQPPNQPLLWRTFSYAYGYAWERGYQTTASVFDMLSLTFLERFDVPFVKIANRPKLRWIADHTQRPCYVSIAKEEGRLLTQASPVFMACVSKYPALVSDYAMFSEHALRRGISDHTVGWGLYKRYRPGVIEKHFVLEHSDDNPDAGPFSVTPEQLSEVL